MSDARRPPAVKQAFSFVLIGSVNALVDAGTLNALLLLRPVTDHVWLTVYNTIAYLLAVVNSYILNSRITFHTYASFGSTEKLNFALQAAVALLVANTVFLLAVRALAAADWPNMPVWAQYNVAKGCSMALSSACSFLLMKYLVFSRGDQ